MAANIKTQLDSLSSISDPQQRSEGYQTLLSTILAHSKGSELATQLVAYACSIIGDKIGVIHSRPMLTHFVEQFRTIGDNDVKTEAGNAVVQTLASRIVSFEAQDTELKFLLADAYEAAGDYTGSARALQGITLDSSQRSVGPDDKARVWMRICRCYLENDEDPMHALAYLNKIKQVIHSVSDPATRLQFTLSQARISDAQGAFLDASASYLALSRERLVDENERMWALSAAITCAVLAPAGPQRARQLGILFHDERASDRPEYSILEKIFLDRLLSPAEVQAFAAGLREHQLAKTADGSTVLERAVLEHNLLAISRLYQNISCAALGTLLNTDAERAEAHAAAMIESSRLAGSIDQIAEMIHFDNARDSRHDRLAAEWRTWEENVQSLAEEVEKVTTMLQREEPEFYDKAMPVA